MGGLGLGKFADDSQRVYEESLLVCASVVEQIVSKSYKYDYDCESKQVIAKLEVKRGHLEIERQKLVDLNQMMSADDRRRLSLAGEKGHRAG